MKESILREYAKLIVRCGVNVQKGQEVMIYADLDQPEFVKLVVEEAYKAKASKVIVEWNYQSLQKIHTRYQSVKTMGTVKDWQKARQQHYCDTLPCRIHIISEDPDGLKGVNMAKVSKANQAMYPIMKPYRDRKVRILNGAHTGFVLGAYLAGFDIVRDCMRDAIVLGYMNKMLLEEIVPILPLDQEDCKVFAAAVQDQIVHDLRHEFDSLWSQRSIWDRGYRESRTPSSPSMLLELLSHQNFADMKLTAKASIPLAATLETVIPPAVIPTTDIPVTVVIRMLPVSTRDQGCPTTATATLRRRCRKPITAVPVMQRLRCRKMIFRFEINL